ncbi:nuclear transport factor 2 family protein [Bosea caraganae]|uniref:Nuclear transport factor 2 family protein n=1 Tax=Bosea caraganae TaxID=2763117 RepID=A0A370LBL4_9HYPH|nr:nuclear transport factor 2 family protein [Bosea caraganae]RDJ27347.1 nuclear transport factor 2 family protein [Bosea caraganae]RDJ29363.1 nuclear transport factor 2 family protein [Bosea caraganae]
MNDDIKAIEAATWTYLDGLYEGDVEKLGQVFHPTSALTQSLDGELKIVPREDWFNAVRNRPAPKATGLERGDHILAIDLVGPGMALVKVKCQMPPRYFTDLLSFLKVEGKWVIAQKVFMTEMGR